MSAYNTFGNDAIGDDDDREDVLTDAGIDSAERTRRYNRDRELRGSEWQNATSDGEMKATAEDGPEYSFWKALKSGATHRRQWIAPDGYLRCADCSALIDPKRDHTCREQIRRNRRRQR